MRNLALLLALALLLSGCAASGSTAETAAETAIETAPQTQPPATTEASQPWDPIQKLLEAMTAEEKVGQLFLARYPEQGAAEDAKQYHLGGYILFGRDIQGHTPDSLRAQLEALQAEAALPLLMAVDEEGGTVCRVSNQAAFRSSRFLSPRELYASGGMEAVLATEQEKASLLKGLGINVIMGPVCDITTEPGAFLYRRSLGQSPEETARFASATVALYRGSAVLKHFPGYGNNADTHTGMATDSRTLEELESRDLLPFAAGISAGCPAILISHTVVSCLDDTLPASLSPAVHTYLRQTMGFEGVAVTDDLVMQAITDAYGAEEAAVLAVLAGNDLLCSSEYPVQYAAVLDAVNTGRIPMQLLDDAVMRVLQWKQTLGLIF